MRRSPAALGLGALLVALGLTAVPARAACPSIVVGPVSLPGGIETEAYSQSLTQTGAVTPAFAITSGVLPTGLAIDAAGNITGTLDAAGSFVFTATATETDTAADAEGCTGGRTYRVVVLAAPTAVDDAATVSEDSSATTIDVLANDTDPDSVGKSIDSAGDPANGTVSITNAGADLTYGPDVNYCNNPPGTTLDTFTYTLTPGGSSATVAVTVTCVNDPPVLTDATPNYTAIGNTQLRAGATPPVIAAVAFSTDASNALAKAGPVTDVDGPGPIEVVAASGASANGGTFSIEADGDFTYHPPTGFTGTDTFAIQVTDNGAPAGLAAATVTIAVSEMVWYVKNNTATAGNAGTSVDPANTLAEAETPSTADDFIYVFQGDGTNSGQNAGITLKNGQKLLGEGVDLVVSSITLVTGNPANKPLVSHTTGNAVTVLANTANGARTGIEIRGLSLSTAGVGFNAIDATSANAAALGVTISENAITGAPNEGIDINAGSTGTGILSIHDNTLQATGTALDIQRTAGTVTITAFDDNSVSGSSAGAGVVVIGVSSPIFFDATPGGAYNTVAGGNTAIGASGNGVGGSGMSLVNVSGDLAFADLDIFADGGAGFELAGTGAVNTGAGTGTRVTVGAGAGIVEATGGPAVSVSTATIDLQLASLKSTSTPSTGVSLSNVSDGTTNAVFSAGSGSSITTTAGATGPIFNVSGGNADIAYAGTITNSSAAARAVSLTTWSGDDGTDDITLSGAIDENGAGILVNGNGGTRPITFSGGMDIDTTTGEGFAATSNTNTQGLHITGTTNDITSTSATALRITSTTIGSSNLNFRNVSSGNNTAAGDPANGIVLSSTGTLGRLIITGAGASGQGGDGTGGLIQNTTGHGISLSDTMNPSFTNMSIQSTAGSGVNGSLIAGFTFDNGTINNSGTAGGTDDSNISFNDSTASANVSGTVTVTDSVLTNSRFHGIDIQHYNGTIAHADIQNNSFTSAASIVTSLGSAIRLDAYGTAAIVGNVTRATINNNVITNFPTGAGIHAFGGNSGGSGAAGTFGVAGSGTDVIAITNNLMNGGSLGVGNQPDRFFTGGVTGSGQGNFNVAGNGTVASPITNIDGVVIELNQFGTGSMTATVNNNIIVANNAVGSAGINVGCDADGTAALDNAVVTATISGNNVSDTDGPGIFAIARGSDCSLTVKILNNTAAAPDTTTAARAGIRVDSGSATGDTTLCLEMSGNTTAGSTNNATTTTSPGINLRKQGTSTTVNIFGIEGLSPSPTGTPNVENHVNSLNTSTSGTFGVNGTALLSATSGFTSCVAP